MSGKRFELSTVLSTALHTLLPLLYGVCRVYLYSLTWALHSCAGFWRKGILTREWRLSDLRKRLYTNAIEQRPITVHAYPC
jgi:hypothetical protein